jgi:hypothetical protein
MIFLPCFTNGHLVFLNVGTVDIEKMKVITKPLDIKLMAVYFRKPRREISYCSLSQELNLIWVGFPALGEHHDMAWNNS